MRKAPWLGKKISHVQPNRLRLPCSTALYDAIIACSVPVALVFPSLRNRPVLVACFRRGVSITYRRLLATTDRAQFSCK